MDKTNSCRQESKNYKVYLLLLYMPTFWHQSKNQEDEEELLRSLSPGKTKRNSKIYIYFLAAIAGIATAAFLIGSLKLGLFVLKFTFNFLKKYWIWVAVSIIVLLFLRKILSRKRVEVHREANPEQY